MIKKIFIGIIIILAIVALGTQVVRVYVFNRNNLESIDATKIQAQIDSLTEKNIETEADVLQSSSYTSIASRAAQLGYQPNLDIVSVYDPQSISLAR